MADEFYENSGCGEVGVSEKTPPDVALNLGALLDLLSQDDTVVEDLPVTGLDRDAGCRCEVGEFVRIRPCAAEHENKTYLGVYLGTFAIDAALQTRAGARSIACITNPAFLVPALRRVVFGAESWWSRIKALSELQDITTEEVDALWYVQALKTAVPT